MNYIAGMLVPKNWFSVAQWGLNKFLQIIIVLEAMASSLGMSASYDISFIHFIKKVGWVKTLVAPASCEDAQ